MSQQRESRNARRAVTVAVVSTIVPVAGHAATNAARVDFAIGDVRGVDKSGKERRLTKGAMVREGDTIRTSRGRAQLRFTDGSRTALLPDTEFRVDEYSFEKQEDENSRSFFSLVRGGLRTITGAIGKLRKRSYKLNTPVATIGIRGTEYLMVLGNSGDLRVGAGEVVAENDAGSFSCSGFCYVPNDQSPMRQVEDQPIYLAPPLTRPRGPEEPGSSDEPGGGGAEVLLDDPRGSISPGRDSIGDGGGGGLTPLQSGQNYTLAVAFGDDDETSIFLRGQSNLVNVTFGSGGGMEGFVDGGVSGTRKSASVVEAGQAGPTGGMAVIGWSRWTNGTYEVTGAGFDNPYCVNSCCSSGTGPEERGLGANAGHHAVAMIPPAEGEALDANSVYSYSLVGFTTPTIAWNNGVAVPGTDGVSGGTLTVDSNANKVNISGMNVVADGGSTQFAINTTGGMTLNPGANYTFSGASNSWVTGPSIGCFPFTYIYGGLTTGFTHAGMAYEVYTGCCGGTSQYVQGTTAWEFANKAPAP